MDMEANYCRIEHNIRSAGHSTAAQLYANVASTAFIAAGIELSPSPRHR